MLCVLQGQRQRLHTLLGVLLGINRKGRVVFQRVETGVPTVVTG